MVSTLRLVLCDLVLQLVVRWDTLLLSAGSPANSAGFHQTLALKMTKHKSGEKKGKTQTRANSD